MFASTAAAVSFSAAAGALLQQLEQHCLLRFLLPARHCLLFQVQRGLLMQLLCCWCSILLAAAAWFVAWVADDDDDDAAFFAAAGAVLFAAGADAA